MAKSSLQVIFIIFPSKHFLQLDIVYGRACGEVFYSMKSKKSVRVLSLYIIWETIS